MGFFGGDDDQSESERLMQEQIQQNKEELELKRKNLYEERLEIIKGQGGQSWTPTVSSASSSGTGKSSGSSMGGLPPLSVRDFNNPAKVSEYFQNAAAKK
jgi:hypothetical protein